MPGFALHLGEDEKILGRKQSEQRGAASSGLPAGGSSGAGGSCEQMASGTETETGIPWRAPQSGTLTKLLKNTECLLK